MSSEEWSEKALQAFDNVLRADGALRARAGQRAMAERVAQTFSAAQLGKVEDGSAPQRAIAVIAAGTGVGKSLAYCAPAIAIALARSTRVVISTATVALQEQLVHKDLPLLAAQMVQPFRFALAKGRGRYVCKLKLERLAGQGGAGEAGSEAEDDLFPDDDAPFSSPMNDARVSFYKTMADALARSDWDGDRDSLAAQPDAAAWRPVAAEASSCTGRHCPVFGECSYFEARKALVGAQVIVVNHDLLLASLGGRVLPELDNCLLVLDEAHHLPATALEQFACRMDLSRLGWIDRLASRALRVGTQLEVAQIADIPAQASSLRQALQTLERLTLDAYGPELRGEVEAPAARSWSRTGESASTRFRPPRGVLAAQLQAPLAEVSAHTAEFLESLRAIANALRAALRDTPLEARRLAALYAQIGMLAPRLEEVHATAALLQQAPAEGSTSVPAAKWFTLAHSGEFLVLQAHASPVLPGAVLRQQLWGVARAVVLTSATLTSCGSFDFFLRESGLWGDEAASTLEVASPFNYTAQGTLVLAETRADPKHAASFVPEMVEALLEDLSRVRAGALVLFTSREQMRQAADALASAMRPRVLVQNQLPRLQLLAQHRESVAAGKPSIIFGMQSFGEGLDLPGTLCESVFITKLPFAPPDDPVGEARAEWLRAVGRDPFSELVVPATALRLAQWVGRAIRSEDDQAHVYCYDKRLSRTGYGKRLLAGLPAFTRLHRPEI